LKHRCTLPQLLDLGVLFRVPDAISRPPGRMITGSTLLTYREHLDGSVTVSATIRYAVTAFMSITLL
jgi:hypothetical protein